jgi:hypothetical protein
MSDLTNTLDGLRAWLGLPPLPLTTPDPADDCGCAQIDQRPPHQPEGCRCRLVAL